MEGGNFLQAGAEPEGKENAGEEAGQISHQFAESDDEEGGSHGGGPTTLSLGKPR